MPSALVDSFRNIATEFADHYGSRDDLAEVGRKWMVGLRPRVNRSAANAKAAAELAAAIAVAPVYIGAGAAVSVIRPAAQFAFAVIGALCETAYAVCHPAASAPRK